MGAISSWDGRTGGVSEHLWRHKARTPTRAAPIFQSVRVGRRDFVLLPHVRTDIYQHNGRPNPRNKPHGKLQVGKLKPRGAGLDFGCVRALAVVRLGRVNDEAQQLENHPVPDDGGEDDLVGDRSLFGGSWVAPPRQYKAGNAATGEVGSEGVTG